MVANLTADKAVPNEFSFNAYAGLTMIASVASGLSSLSGPALLDKLSSSTAADAGAFGTIDFTKIRDSKAFPRLFNAKVWYSEIKNGAWTGVTADAPATDVGSYLP